MFHRRRTPQEGQGTAPALPAVVPSPEKQPCAPPTPSPAKPRFNPEDLSEAEIDALAACKKVRSGIQSRMGREGLAKRKAKEALTKQAAPA